MDELTESQGRPRGTSSASSTDETFSLMRTYLDQQFSSFKRELRDEIQSSSAENFKRFKQSSQLHTFKWEGNKRQYHFNCEVLDGLDNVVSQVKRGEQSKCLETLEGIQKSVGRRNKLIKLADKSEGGWDTVREYESDDLASDSDDDKRIRRAESRALSKKKKKRSSQRLPASQTFPDNESVSSSLFGGFPAARPDSGAFRPFRRGHQLIQCFGCGGWGHTRAECPRRGPGVADYPVPRRASGPWQPAREQQQQQTTPVNRQQLTNDSK